LPQAAKQLPLAVMATRLQQNLRCGMVGGPPRGRGFQRQYDPLTSALDPETDP